MKEASIKLQLKCKNPNYIFKQAKQAIELKQAIKI